MTSSASQSRKWQLIGMSQWCRSALCDHPFPALTDNWTHGASIRHTIAPINHTGPSPRSRSYYSFSVPLRVGGWVGTFRHDGCLFLELCTKFKVGSNISYSHWERPTFVPDIRLMTSWELTSASVFGYLDIFAWSGCIFVLNWVQI